MEAVIFCGIQGSGKSTFYRERFFNTHVRINLDMLRTRSREAILTRACVEARQPFVVDNTNPTRQERARYMELARTAGFHVIGYYFDSGVREAMGRNLGRPEGQRISPPGVMGTYKRLQIPTRAEGFDRLYHVRIAGDGQFVVEAAPDGAGDGS